MLVLSRRLNEKIVLPTVGVTVHVLDVKGGAVKIGVDAPPEVRVLRQELAQNGASAAREPSAAARTHALRNELNKLGLSLHLFERQWQAGKTLEASATLDRVFALLDSMEQKSIGSAKPKPAPERQQLTLVVVVEDDHNERELLAGFLRMKGCDCETAADGLEALDYLSSHERPDVVLLDLRMPRCDGPETLARIRRDPRYAGLKIFAVSGTAPQELGIRTGSADGVDGWFPKPLNPHKLCDAIQQSLGLAPADN